MKNNYFTYIVCCFLLIGFSCKKEMKISKETQIEQKVDSLLKLMTLEEKIGQMSQIRHFEESADVHVSEKFIGSIIHTQGPTPGKTALDWQKRFIELQKLVSLSISSIESLLISVDCSIIESFKVILLNDFPKFIS